MKKCQRIDGEVAVKSGEVMEKRWRSGEVVMEKW